MNKIPEIGEQIKVNSLDGQVIDGVVTGHGFKDGRPIIDYEGRRVKSDGTLSKVCQFWAWPGQIQTADTVSQVFEVTATCDG